MKKSGELALPRPVLVPEAFDSRELTHLRGNEGTILVKALGGDEGIVGANSFAGRFQRCANFTRSHGVAFIEDHDFHRRREEIGEVPGLFRDSHTVIHSVPKLMQHNRRQEYPMAAADSLLET